MTLKNLWLDIVQKKKTTLCVGIDPACEGQRGTATFSGKMNKTEWTLQLIEMVAPYAAAIKLNRNYFKDTDAETLQEINSCIHAHQMLSIDDSKLADIGSSNDAGLFHAKNQGFDAVTYAPFPGNIEETVKFAKSREIALIMLVRMSNPEFSPISSALVGDLSMSEFLAQQLDLHDVDGMVVGAPSSGNSISRNELINIDQKSGGNRLALVPGIGAQGGDMSEIIEIFSTRAMLNVGRSITYHENPRQAAAEFCQIIRSQLLG